MKNKKPNIIFLSIDALRPRNMSCYGYKRNTSPNIDSYANQGALFKNFFTVSNCSNKSFFSILSGRHLLLKDILNYPSQEEMKTFFDTGGIFLQEILQKQGYKTYFLWKSFGWQKKGFDYYFKQDSFQASKKWNLIRSIKKKPLVYNFLRFLLHRTYIIPRKLENKIRFNDSGERATNKAIEIIKQNKENSFFMWLHYTDTHGPYMFPYWLANKFLPNKEGKKIMETLNATKGYSKKAIEMSKSYQKFDETFGGLVARYDTAISYDDFLIGRIINTLKEQNLLKDTIVFIFADHGDNFGEHVICFSHAGVYDETFHIPLIIFGEGIPKNKKIEALAQSKDLAPTVLDLIGVKHGPDLFDGKSLLPLLSGEETKTRPPILMEHQISGMKRRAIRTKKYKYVESPDKENSVCYLCNTTHGPLVGLYDLEKDPEENINLAATNKEIVKEMKSKLDQFLKDLRTLNEKRRIQNIINQNK